MPKIRIRKCRISVEHFVTETAVVGLSMWVRVRAIRKVHGHNGLSLSGRAPKGKLKLR